MDYVCVQIQKKLNKGKSISQIADECEESEEEILIFVSWPTVNFEYMIKNK